jgi:hypothetical protein
VFSKGGAGRNPNLTLSRRRAPDFVSERYGDVSPVTPLKTGNGWSERLPRRTIDRLLLALGLPPLAALCRIDLWGFIELFPRRNPTNWATASQRHRPCIAEKALSEFESSSDFKSAAALCGEPIARSAWRAFIRKQQPQKLRDLYGQFACDPRRAKDEDIFTQYQLCAVGE